AKVMTEPKSVMTGPDRNMSCVCQPALILIPRLESIMKEFLTRFQFPIAIIISLSGAAFLLKMCYLSLAFNTAFGIVFLTVVYVFVRLRYDLTMPPLLLGLVLAGVEIDALGNYWRLYGSQFGPLQYDEFAHLTIQVLVTPVIVWLTGRAMLRLGYQVTP